MHTYRHANACAHIHKCRYTHAWAHIHICRHTYGCTHMHTCRRTYTCAHMHRHTYARAHIHALFCTCHHLQGLPGSPLEYPQATHWLSKLWQAPFHHKFQLLGGFQASCECNDMHFVTEIMIRLYTHSSLSSLSALTGTYAMSLKSKAPHQSLL